ncbi:unspecified product [Leptomonas pyrrhocoris]|uniref:Unspecified product n=1 Tax=Leptomonas pyrrhocoris TaxID=157538 RepID=A0A0M9FTA0_LEPPY|nr:unspecified product [Leptomonas pyrrhocoris]KPA75527.1 unspecified product [Leptomonas pyrrhocoris]|eukprot:XP_015653966.1 unspecified product [Leptomonas pyrrhocoris]
MTVVRLVVVLTLPHLCVWYTLPCVLPVPSTAEEAAAQPDLHLYPITRHHPEVGLFLLELALMSLFVYAVVRQARANTGRGGGRQFEDRYANRWMLPPLLCHSSAGGGAGPTGEVGAACVPVASLDHPIFSPQSSNGNSLVRPRGVAHHYLQHLQQQHFSFSVSRPSPPTSPAGVANGNSASVLYSASDTRHEGVLSSQHVWNTAAAAGLIVSPSVGPTAPPTPPRKAAKLTTLVKRLLHKTPVQAMKRTLGSLWGTGGGGAEKKSKDGPSDIWNWAPKQENLAGTSDAAPRDRRRRAPASSHVGSPPPPPLQQHAHTDTSRISSLSATQPSLAPMALHLGFLICLIFFTWRLCVDFYFAWFSFQFERNDALYIWLIPSGVIATAAFLFLFAGGHWYRSQLTRQLQPLLRGDSAELTRQRRVQRGAAAAAAASSLQALRWVQWCGCCVPHPQPEVAPVPLLRRPSPSAHESPAFHKSCHQRPPLNTRLRAAADAVAAGKSHDLSTSLRLSSNEPAGGGEHTAAAAANVGDSTFLFENSVGARAGADSDSFRHSPSGYESEMALGTVWLRHGPHETPLTRPHHSNEDAEDEEEFDNNISSSSAYDNADSWMPRVRPLRSPPRPAASAISTVAAAAAVATAATSSSSYGMAIVEATPSLSASISPLTGGQDGFPTVTSPAARSSGSSFLRRLPSTDLLQHGSSTGSTNGDSSRHVFRSAPATPVVAAPAAHRLAPSARPAAFTDSAFSDSLAHWRDKLHLPDLFMRLRRLCGHRRFRGGVLCEGCTAPRLNREEEEEGDCLTALEDYPCSFAASSSHAAAAGLSRQGP